MKILSNIENLIQELPKSDISIAQYYIKKRDFQSLYDLTDSAIARVIKGLKKEEKDQKEEYKTVDITNLRKLKGEIILYIDQLSIPEQEEEEYYESDSYQQNEFDLY